MSQKLPKSVREALAKHTAGDGHPSPDALTAFVEHSLPSGESQRVTNHLAKCADCREVVFLASNAVEEQVGEEPEWMPAAAVPRISPALRAKTVIPRIMASADPDYPDYPPPRRSWMLRWAWVPAVAVALLVVSAVWVWRSESLSPRLQSRSIVPSKGPQPGAPNAPQTLAAAPESEIEADLAMQKTPAKGVRANTNPAQTSHTVTAQLESNAAEPYPPAPMVAPAPPVESSPDTALGGVAPKSAILVPSQNGFVESETPNMPAPMAKAQAVLGKPTPGMYAVRATRPQWRITSDGHLEHSTTPDTWTRALDDQPITFHVVSVVAGNVWAGGSGGALFHSSDGGQSWSKEALASPPIVETGTIVSIRFSDTLHGVVTTDGGSRWSTSDGGATWTKE